jgi:hypothetical protein
VRVIAVTPAGKDRATTWTSTSRRGWQEWPGRSTGHPGLASTTPEISAAEGGGRTEFAAAGGWDGCAELAGERDGCAGLAAADGRDG